MLKMKIHYKTIEKDEEYLRQVSEEVNFNNNDYIKYINKVITTSAAKPKKRSRVSTLAIASPGEVRR